MSEWMAWLPHLPLEIWLAAGLALYMAWAIGANDVANAMCTSVGSGAITYRQAILFAAIFEFAGAFLAGGHVTETIRSGMLDMRIFDTQPMLLVWGMLAALAASGTWLVIASIAGWPVSTTHSIVGAIVGFAAVGIGPDAVTWGKITQIVVSWFTSPILGGTISFLVFQIIRRTVLDQEDPVQRAKAVGPYFVFAVFFVVSLVTSYKGLENLKLHLGFTEACLLSALIGFVAAVAAWGILRTLWREGAGHAEEGVYRVERVFGALMLLTACSMAFAHGANDVANAIGPLAAIVQTVRDGNVASKASVDLWMLVVGGVGIVVGLSTYGWKVMETAGKKITELTPSRGFAAEFSAMVTIIVASRLGIPVSTTHILVGAILGVGFARGIGAIDLRVVGKVMLSWVITLPVGAVLSIFFFYFFKGLFG